LVLNSLHSCQNICTIRLKKIALCVRMNHLDGTTSQVDEFPSLCFLVNNKPQKCAKLEP
jgi:hypothetical protein